MNRLTVLLVLTLGSGALLLASGLIGLDQARTAAELRSREQARRNAEITASALRSALAETATLDELPTATRFAVRDGEVVVDPDLRWLERPASLQAPWPISQVLERAQRLAASEGAAAARSLLAGALPHAGSEDRPWLLAPAAWFAHRAGDDEAATAVLAELSASPTSLPIGVFASVLLLAATREGRVPAWAEAGLAQLPPQPARGMVLRLATAGVDVGRLERKLRQLEVRRHVVRLARTASREIAEAETPLLRAIGDEMLVYLPDDSGVGSGGVVATDRLLDVLRARTGLDARLTLAKPLPRESAVVVPEVLGVLPTDAGDTPAWLRSWALPALLTVLAACFVFGLIVVFRSLQREQLATRARADFLTSVTHELRTPLSSIRLLAEMLEEGRVTDPQRQQEYFRMLAGESLRLSVLIENVLDLRRIERGERSYDRRRHQPAEVVREAVELFAPVSQRDGVAIELRLDERPATAVFDSSAFSQALLNVMDNARKYAGDGGVLELEGGSDGNLYHLRVRDHGPGVPAGEEAAIFERFRRGAGQADGSTPGVGLGLYLARSILRAHGGDLVLESSPGAGATFHFTLPLEGQAA